MTTDEEFLSYSFLTLKHHFHQELAEVCRKGQVERDSMDIERVQGMGFGRYYLDVWFRSDILRET